MTSTEWITGEEAAAQTGASIAEVDQAAATGAIPAQYFGWQLLVSIPEPEPGTDEVQRISITGGPNGGSFLLIFDGQPTARLRITRAPLRSSPR